MKLLSEGVRHSRAGDVCGFVLLLICVFAAPFEEGLRNTALVAFMLAWLISRCVYKDVDWTFDLWDFAFFAFLASALTTMIVVKLDAGLMTKFSHVCRYLIAGWMIRHSRITRAQVEWLFAAVLLSTAWAMGLSMMAYLESLSPRDLQLPNVQHVNHASMYVLISLQMALAALCYVYSRRRYKTLFVLFLYAVFSLVWLLCAESRAATGLAFLSIAVFLLYPILLHRKSALKMVLMAVVVGGIALALQPKVLQKQVGWSESFVGEGKISPREKIWSAAVLVWSEKPLLGRGYDQYKQVTPDLVQSVLLSRDEPYDAGQFRFAGHAHNLYLNVLVEHGLVGVSATLLLLMVWLVALFKCFSVSRNNSFQLAFWLFSVCLLMLVLFGGGVTTTLRKETAFLVFVFLGVWLSSDQREVESGGYSLGAAVINFLIKQYNLINKKKDEYEVIVHHGNKAIYYPVAKVANSSLKALSAEIISGDVPESLKKRNGWKPYSIFRHYDGKRFLRKSNLLMPASRAVRLQGYWSYGFVRNPWDRLVSCYKDKINNDKSDSAYVNGVYQGFVRYGDLFHRDMSFPEFAAAVCSISDKDSNHHFKSQYEFFYVGNKMKVDFVGKFENLSSDFEFVKGVCGYPEGLSLPHHMKTDGGSYKDYYSEELVELVRKRYYMDVNLFGYEFRGPLGGA